MRYNNSMQITAFTRHKTMTFLQTLLLLVVMLGFLGLLGLVIAGTEGIIIALLAGLFLLLLYPSVSPDLIARIYGANPLPKSASAALHSYMEELATRAGLPAVPTLYLLNTPVMTAFSVGRRRHAAIILSHGMIDRLSLPEIVGVMAHETAHIANNDLWLMNLTDIITRLTALLSVLGQLMVVFFLPLYLLAGVPIPWAGIAILIGAPALSTVLQLSLSRVREYDADLTAAYLTGSPRYLASALTKIEYEEQGLLQRLLLPGRKEEVPSLFRTHPDTAKRIEKLLALTLPPDITPLRYDTGTYHSPAFENDRAVRTLLRYLLGHWH